MSQSQIVSEREPEERGPEQILRDAEPLSRDSLADREVCHAIHEFALESDRLGNANLMDTAAVARAYADTNIFERELATALDWHGVVEYSDKVTSDAFLDRLARLS